MQRGLKTETPRKEEKKLLILGKHQSLIKQEKLSRGLNSGKKKNTSRNQEIKKGYSNRTNVFHIVWNYLVRKLGDVPPEGGGTRSTKKGIRQEVTRGRFLSARGVGSRRYLKTGRLKRGKKILQSLKKKTGFENVLREGVFEKGNFLGANCA